MLKYSGDMLWAMMVIVGLGIVGASGCQSGVAQTDEVESGKTLQQPVSEWKRIHLLDGRIIEVKRGKRYRILTEGGSSSRALTPDQKRRHAELSQRLGTLLNKPDRDAHQEEIDRLRNELTQPEFQIGGGGRSDETHFARAYPGQEAPPESETVLIDLQGADARSSGSDWRIAGQWK